MLIAIRAPDSPHHIISRVCLDQQRASSCHTSMGDTAIHASSCTWLQQAVTTAFRLLNFFGCIRTKGRLKTPFQSGCKSGNKCQIWWHPKQRCAWQIVPSSGQRGPGGSVPLPTKSSSPWSTLPRVTKIYKNRSTEGRAFPWILWYTA